MFRVPVCARVSRACPVCVSRLPPVSFYRYTVPRELHSSMASDGPSSGSTPPVSPRRRLKGSCAVAAEKPNPITPLASRLQPQPIRQDELLGAKRSSRFQIAVGTCAIGASLAAASQMDSEWRRNGASIAVDVPVAESAISSSSPFDLAFAQGRLVSCAQSEASAVSIAAAAKAREPVCWSRSFARSWRALRWDISGLGADVPWLVARVQQGSEFVLTAPERGGLAPLLQGAPSWEPLWPETRNVSVADVLLTPRDGAAHKWRFYYSGSLGEAATSHWRTASLLTDLDPAEPMKLKDVPPLEPDTTPAEPEAAGGRGRTLPLNSTSLRVWLTSSDVLARTHHDKNHRCPRVHVCIQVFNTAPFLPHRYALRQESQLALRPPRAQARAAMAAL